MFEKSKFIPKSFAGVVAGTMVQLANGDCKRVEDFEVGDVVATLAGDRKVTAIWNPNTLIDGTFECHEIEFVDGYKVICSDKYKFLIDEEWDNMDDWMESENLFPNLSVKKIDDTYLPIEKVTYIGNANVYNLSVGDAQHYVLENGVIVHNEIAYGSILGESTILEETGEENA